MLALKNRVAVEFFTVLKYILLFRIFEQLAVALKTEFALKIFKPGVAAAPPDPPPRTPMHATTGKRSSSPVCHTKNELSCSYVAQKVKLLTDTKLWAEKCIGQDRHFQSMLIESDCKTKD